MSKSYRGKTSQQDNLRAACYRVWGRSCMYCGDRATEVDHIIELAAGGTNTIDNVQPLCKDCHKAKTAKFNSTRQRGTQSHSRVFLRSPEPTDSLALISPRLLRFDPPTKDRPES